MLEADKLISYMWEWDFNLAGRSQGIVRWCSSVLLDYLLSACGWNVKLPHRSAVTISQREDILCASSLALVHVSSSVRGRAAEPWVSTLKPRNCSAGLKYFSWELQGLFHISPTFHTRRSFYFFSSPRLEGMFEDGRVLLVGTIKHLGFLRNAGLEDVGICINSIIWY